MKATETKAECKKECGAKTRAGTPCQRAPMPNGRCDKHGGKSLRGIASPRFKHGFYSKDFPTHVLGTANLLRAAGVPVETMAQWEAATATAIAILKPARGRSRAKP